MLSRPLTGVGLAADELPICPDKIKAFSPMHGGYSNGVYTPPGFSGQALGINNSNELVARRHAYAGVPEHSASLVRATVLGIMGRDGRVTPFGGTRL
jgi:hypothetical protein